MSGWSRCRRVGKWLGIGACAAIVAGFGLSERWYVDCYSSNRVLIHLLHGSVAVAWRVGGIVGGATGAEPPHRWLASRYSEGMPRPIWWVRDSRGPAWRAVTIPLWMMFAPFATVTALLWRSRRRAVMAGHCRRCGYDLTGNVSGQCSECGFGIAPVPA